MAAASQRGFTLDELFGGVPWGHNTLSPFVINARKVFLKTETDQR